MCAHLTTELATKGINVLWASTEDDPAEDIQRRLLAAGADRKAKGDIRFFKVDPKLPADLSALEYWIGETNAGLLVLDPGRSFLGASEGVRDFSFNNEAHVRPGLEVLNRLAKRAGCTVASFTTGTRIKRALRISAGCDGGE